MKKILFFAIMTLFLLGSCENKERLDEIKAELKSTRNHDDHSINSSSKVSFSTPTQNEKKEEYEENNSDELEYNSDESYSEDNYSEDDYEPESDYESEYESEY